MYGDERGFGDPLFSQRTLLQTGDGTPGGATGIRLFKATRLMDEQECAVHHVSWIYRFLWSESLSDNRVATTGEILQSSSWPTDDLVCNLQEFHNRADAPQLINTRIEGQPSVLVLFCRSSRSPTAS